VDFTPTDWILVGGGDNVRQALFDLFNAPTNCMQSHDPLSFRLVRTLTTPSSV
jgi:hypothetical protein